MSVALVQAFVKYVFTGHCFVQLLITLLPSQKYAPAGQRKQMLLFLYMEGMQVKLHQVPFHDDMLATGVQGSQRELLALVQFSG